MKKNDNKYDVIVVGSGHAGVEACSASARMGLKTAVVTFDKKNIGELSCNPSIGGLGKGHLVREIDALGGLMGKLADKAGIQHRVLNASKGPAVQGLRTQLDRNLYRDASLEMLNELDNLNIIEGEVLDVLLIDDKISGVKVLYKNSEEIILEASSVVITIGTFGNGKMIMGNETIPGGRVNMEGDDEPSSSGISKFLENNNFDLIRLKTGTPARLKLSSMDTKELEVQYADENPEFFSFQTKNLLNPQISCFITKTNIDTHNIIEKAVDDGLAPLFNGFIDSKGPRYCPSIEDKVVRFPHHKSHNIFLEPEGIDSDLVYPNGMSTSLPKDIQLKFFRSMKGLENVDIVRYGYAIEYDAIDARELGSDLGSKKIKGLYFAGQINGTSGYEEAACQGVVAGINAALNSQNKDSFILSRADAFTGVLIDDITTHGLDEPYRMFTSRSEYRLSLRADNADQRLSFRAMELDLLSDVEKNSFKKKLNDLDMARRLMKSLEIFPSELKKFGIEVHSGGNRLTAMDLFKYHEVNFSKVEEIFSELKDLDYVIKRQLEIEGKYQGYFARQERDIVRFKKDFEMKISPSIDYDNIDGLSLEIRQKLKKVMPDTIAQASRISGVTPAAITILLRFVRSI